jgi:hypothetical protein
MMIKNHEENEGNDGSIWGSKVSLELGSINAGGPSGFGR